LNVVNNIKGWEIGAIAPNSIVNADCLEAMKLIPNKSIDAIIADLPYGVTSCAWDVVIPFEPLWEQYKRIIKTNGAICLFGSQPFTSALVMSNPRWFKCEWIWEKGQGTRFYDAKKRPLNNHENILVFCERSPRYYPQMVKVAKLLKDKTPNKSNLEYTSIYSSNSNYRNKQLWKETGYRYPKTVLHMPKHNGCLFGVNTSDAFKHPSKKPVPLIEYLIKTYSLEGELILDNTAGSGTLAIAAINTNRRYICIEKDEHYFEVMRNKIENHDPLAPIKTKKPKAVPKGQLALF
jgi:site-specific DNA-methyltransferase (adenine-specific)